ncbi:branched-chain amino acid ABC transporter permease [Mycobacterium aquaticum]|uniref:Branched-chain amino acid ABC transporter permease n=1 Tax=Mycobacterium aquaticum TaxID=1927124 RepID=A0A1X0BAW1_9MYCO|nr:branched-chain amino acid ABC transporter permease [Mycobacterium aquaticum]ORA39238.1 branched-chain amino acid ABC transporter permease [Mycobacterium aquaticum]
MNSVLAHLINALSLGGTYALSALGIALIFGVMRLINFAHAQIIMVAGYFTLLVSNTQWPAVVATTIAVGVALAVGMERIAFRPVRDAAASTLLVTSFAVSSLIENLLILVAGSRSKSVNVFGGLTKSVDIAGMPVQLIDIATVALSSVLVAAVIAVLARTPIGIQIRAASENFQMARLLGVRANRVIAVAFAISGILAAVLALLIVARTGSLFPELGQQPALIGFVATVIGGMGSIGGAVLGAYLIGAVTVALDVVLPTAVSPYRDAFVFAVVIVVLLVRPRGLIPSRFNVERV